MKSWLCCSAALALLGTASAASSAERRAMRIDDLDRIRNVGSPQVDPSGTWVAYTVQSVDAAADRNSTHIWMTRWDGTRTIQLTNRPKESENTPRWSPDGRSLAFISSRGEEKENDQLWIMDREGGEARKAADIKGSLADYAWSPDGRRIAFVSDRSEDPDRSYNDDIFLVGTAGAASEPRRLTTYEGSDNNPDRESYPVWSPDGRSIAYLQGGPVKLLGYGVTTLAVIPAAGGAPRILTAPLDRNVSHPAWSPDGRSIQFVVEDDGATWIGSVPALGGTVRYDARLKR